MIKKQTRDINLAKSLGYEGERLVELFFKLKNHKVLLSDNPYDEEKDMQIDGVNSEVKTQITYRNARPYGDSDNTEPAFTVNVEANGRVYRNQKHKCMTVKRLIFVKRPDPMDPVIRIYEAPPPESRKCYVKPNKWDGRLVALFLLKDLTELGVIEDQDLIKRFWDDGYAYTN